MEEKALSRDELAQRMYETTYERLSSWGKAEVNSVLARVSMSNTPRAATLNERNPLADNEKLAKENENLRLENMDLWDENTELKEEVEEMRHELEEIHTSRNTGDR
jgi:hypothetical protein